MATLETERFTLSLAVLPDGNLGLVDEDGVWLVNDQNQKVKVKVDSQHLRFLNIQEAYERDYVGYPVMSLTLLASRLMLTQVQMQDLIRDWLPVNARLHAFGMNGYRFSQNGRDYRVGGISFGRGDVRWEVNA